MMDLTYISKVRESGEESENFVEWEGPGELLDDTDQPIRERMLDVIVPLEESMSASELAEQVGCDTETAGAYLEWFVSMGIVLKHPSYSDARPIEYERTLTTAMEARRTESE